MLPFLKHDIFSKSPLCPHHCLNISKLQIFLSRNLIIFYIFQIISKYVLFISRLWSLQVVCFLTDIPSLTLKRSCQYLSRSYVCVWVCDSYDLQNLFRIDKRKIFYQQLFYNFLWFAICLLTETISCLGIQEERQFITKPTTALCPEKLIYLSKTFEQYTLYN